MDSYKDMKKSTPVTESPLSKSYSEETSNTTLHTSMFEHTDVDPVTLTARRRRSASLGDYSFYPRGSPHQEGVESTDERTPVVTTNNSMNDGDNFETPSILEDPTSHPTTSFDDASLNIPKFGIVGVEDNIMATSSHSSIDSESDHASLAPPPRNGIGVPSVEVSSPILSSSSKDQCLENGRQLSRSCETDGGFDSDLHYDDTVVLRQRNKEGLSLDDIAVGFKRRSLSLESLVKAYKENRLSLFQMGHQNCASFEVSEDEEDIEDDEEEEEDKDDRSNRRDSLEGESFFLNSTTCSNFGETLSDFDASISTLNSSLNSSLLHELQDDGKDRDEDRVKTVLALNELQDNIQTTEPRQAAASTTSEDLEIKSATPTPCSSENTVMADGIKVKRSKSQSSKGTLRKNRVKLRKPKSFAEPATSEDVADVTSGSTDEVLLRFQTASLRCSLGNTSREPVRTLLQESVPNTEKENYQLSLERE